MMETPVYMDTPVYPPAAAYEAPVVLPYALSLDGCPVAELMADPVAWAVVLKHVPSVAFIANIPATQKLLGNMTVTDFSIFGLPLDPKVITQANMELARFRRTGGPQ